MAIALIESLMKLYLKEILSQTSNFPSGKIPDFVTINYFLIIQSVEDNFYKFIALKLQTKNRDKNFKPK